MKTNWLQLELNCDINQNVGYFLCFGFRMLKRSCPLQLALGPIFQNPFLFRSQKFEDLPTKEVIFEILNLCESIDSSDSCFQVGVHIKNSCGDFKKI